MNNIVKCIIAVFVLFISFFATFIIKSELSDNTQQIDSINEYQESDDSVVIDHINIPQQDTVDSLLTISDSVSYAKIEDTLTVYKLLLTIEDPVCDYNTLTYNLNVQINNLPEKATAMHYIFGKQGNDTIAKSVDGKFKGIPPTSDGEYKLSVQWKDSIGIIGQGLDTLIIGFKPFEKPKMKKMEVSELTRRINMCDRKLAIRNSKISSALKLNFSNLKPDEKSPETMDEIFNKIKFGMWSSISVSSVDYNEDNQIISITIIIKHNEE